MLTFTPFYKNFGGFINKTVLQSNDDINGSMFITNQILPDFIFGIFGILSLNNILNSTNQFLHTFALIISRGLISNIKEDRNTTFSIT